MPIPPHKQHSSELRATINGNIREKSLLSPTEIIEPVQTVSLTKNHATPPTQRIPPPHYYNLPESNGLSNATYAEPNYAHPPTHNMMPYPYMVPPPNFFPGYAQPRVQNFGIF